MNGNGVPIKVTRNKRENSPLCPWIFSGVNPIAKLDLDAEDTSKPISVRSSAEDYELIWKEEPQGVTLVAQPQPTDSIECACGIYSNFVSLSDSLRKNNLSFRTDSQEYKDGVRIVPSDIKRISLICCQVKSFKGLTHFPRLRQLFISDGLLPELLWDAFELSHTLQELSIVYSEIKEIEMLKFTRLTKLNLWANMLTNLKFLGCGLPTLKVLNVAENRITALHKENLFKCFNLEIFNISGNPICTLSDIKALRVCPFLKSVYFNDVLHGDCPIVSICSYRTAVICLLENILFLDGIEIREEDREFISDNRNQSSLKYQVNESLESFENSDDRKTLCDDTQVELAAIEKRLREFQVLCVNVNRVIRIMNIVPGMYGYVPCLKKDVHKIDLRISILRYICNKIFKDTSKKLKIGKWEKGVQTWLNRLDFDTFGYCQGELLYSSLKCPILPKDGEDEEAVDKEKLARDFLFFIRSSSCQYSYPKKLKICVESVFIITLHAMEIGLQRIYSYAQGSSVEPGFVKQQYCSQYLTDYYRKCIANRPKSPNPNRLIHGLFYDYNRDMTKVVQKSFRNSDWKPEYKYSFPDSIPGLPDPGTLLYLFLICPDSKKETSLEYLHRIMTGNSQCHKCILLTTCAWKAMNRRSSSSEPFSVLVIVKALKDFLIPVDGDKITEALHHDKICQTYCLEEGVAFTPAFVLCLSFFPLEKKTYSGESIDKEIIYKCKKHLHKYSSKLGSAMKNRRIRLSKGTMFLNKTEDNIVVVDLTSMMSYPKQQSCETNVEKAGGDENMSLQKENRSSIADGHISHFLGDHSLHKITKLKLSCNNLTELAGLQGLRYLKCLDISHNNLQTLDSLPILGNVKEFRGQFNALHSFENCLEKLAVCFTRLTTVEILPNPFQDIVDWSYIPILLQKKINKINRVDGWILPFNNSYCLSKIRAPKAIDYNP